MTNKITVFVWVSAMTFIAVALAQVAFTQIQTDTRVPTSLSPVAFVYVISTNQNEIIAFAAGPDGSLTGVKGSPFTIPAGELAVNGKYLFASDAAHIYSLSIASDGAIKKVATIDALKFNDNNCGSIGPLFLDRTGGNLYDFDLYYDCANHGYQSYRIDPATGRLTYLGLTKANLFWLGSMSFIASNRFAYNANCFGYMGSLIYGFRRNNNGTMTDLGKDFARPQAKPGDSYCPYLTSTDQANHVAMSVQALNQNGNNDGSPQLATYTAHPSGDLTTKSTYQNMPATADTYVNDIAISPSGKLLAVGGDAGLEVFYFNGSKPITSYTGLLTSDEVDQFFWDNDNHLYATSYQSGKLFVFTITPTSVSQAPGSPYPITNPLNIVVLPKT